MRLRPPPRPRGKIVGGGRWPITLVGPEIVTSGAFDKRHSGRERRFPGGASRHIMRCCAFRLDAPMGLKDMTFVT